MMRELTQEEIDQVHGGVGPLVIGALGATAGALAYYVGSDNPTVEGALTAMAYGAVGGAIGASGRLVSAAVGAAMTVGGSAAVRIVERKTLTK